MDLCPPDLCPKKKQKEMISALVLNDQLMSIEYIVEIHANPWLLTKRIQRFARIAPSSTHSVEELSLLVSKCASNTLQSCVGWNRSSNTWAGSGGKQASALVHFVNGFLWNEKIGNHCNHTSISYYPYIYIIYIYILSKSLIKQFPDVWSSSAERLHAIHPDWT